jgi:hypothetical protein
VCNKFVKGGSGLGSRGRKSIAELMITDSSTGIINRPDAPYDLTDIESDEWRAIVSSMPPEHFARIHYPMLSQLCRHIVAARRVAQMVEQCARQKKLNRVEFASLLALQAAESAAIIRLCRSMRLTQQSIYRADATGRLRPTAMLKAPWEPDD